MAEQLLSPTFLFRYSVPCHKTKKNWTQKGVALDEKYSIPNFRELEGTPSFANVRMAWSDTGMIFNVDVEGKTQPPWCRPTRIEDSDGFHVWIDTRDTQNIHRASRFCHQFVFMPVSGGTQQDQNPYSTMLKINRAKEESRSLNQGKLQVATMIRKGGYRLQVFIPAASMFGFDVNEHPRIGFYYAVVDRELGWQYFSVGPEFPFQENPTLWGSLEFVE